MMGRRRRDCLLYTSDVNVTFPEQYQAAELAGKPAVFKIKLHEVKYKELPLSLIHI